MTPEPYRDETEAERLDRQLAELLQELRVILPGVQVLFAFLLTVPFSARFEEVTDTERGVYVGVLLATALATILLMAPTALHRLRFRQHRKREIVDTAHRLTLAGLAVLALAVSAAVFLMVDMTYGRRAGWWPRWPRWPRPSCSGGSSRCPAAAVRHGPRTRARRLGSQPSRRILAHWTAPAGDPRASWMTTCAAFGAWSRHTTRRPGVSGGAAFCSTRPPGTPVLGAWIANWAHATFASVPAKAATDEVRGCTRQRSWGAATVVVAASVRGRRGAGPVLVLAADGGDGDGEHDRQRDRDAHHNARGEAVERVVDTDAEPSRGCYPAAAARTRRGNRAAGGSAESRPSCACT